ncbi:MAG: PEP-CTERM sorting domain-containing protein [bacterium]|nr:PEP-CTERM sorting domain-containing protein [bacterium]
MRNGLVAVMALACCVSTASAATISFQNSFSFPLSPNSDTKSLSKFDDLGGTLTLTKVTLYIDALVGSSLTAENDSQLPAPLFQASLTGLVTATSPDLSVSAAMADNWPISLAASNGLAGEGTDFHDFGYLSKSDTDSDQIATPTDLSFYVGAGNFFDVDIDGTAGWGFSGTTDATLTVADLGAEGIVKVTYEYVPEPTSLALLAAGGLFLRRRR